MIDTIGFRFHFTDEQFEKFRALSKEATEINNVNKWVRYRLIKNNFRIGSYDSSITIRCFEDSYGRLEFSAPKFLYGHNVFLLYPEQLEAVVLRVEDGLREKFGDFPPSKSWELDRLDLCYAWRFPDNATAVEVFRILRTLDYPRKEKNPYPTSVQWKAKTYTVKAYLKQPEYFEHDARHIRIDDPERHADIVHESEGVLRYEISCRKAMIEYLFENKHVYYTDLINQPKLLHILQTTFLKLTENLNKEVMDTQKVLELLTHKYSPKRAEQLYEFYIAWFCSPEYNRQRIKETIDRSTVYRRKRQLREAGIGLSSETQLSFPLTIPSPFVVNTYSPTPEKEVCA